MVAEIKIENIVFWILMAVIIGIAVWLLIGSPTDTSAMISISVFIAASEILIWRNIFNIDKKTTIGFERIKNDINTKFKELHSKLENIENLANKKK